MHRSAAGYLNQGAVNESNNPEDNNIMPMTIEEKVNQIIEDIRQEKGINPVHIFKNMAKKDYISIHGPEHHVMKYI